MAIYIADGAEDAVISLLWTLHCGVGVGMTVYRSRGRSRCGQGSLAPVLPSTDTRTIRQSIPEYTCAPIYLVACGYI